jgi:hypothetical protein
VHLYGIARLSMQLEYDARTRTRNLERGFIGDDLAEGLVDLDHIPHRDFPVDHLGLDHSLADLRHLENERHDLSLSF